MKLKGIVFTAVIATSIAFGGSAFAHGGKHARWKNMSEQERLEAIEKRLDKKVDRMDEELDLTDAQERKVRQILEKSKTKLIDIRKRNKGDRQAGKKEARQVFKGTKAELAKVLTAEQKEKFKEMRHERRKKRHHKRGKRMFAKLDRALDLDAKQEKQVKAIMQETRKEIRQLKDLHEGDRQAFRQSMKTAMQESATEIDKVLDADQKKKFKQMRQRMKKRFQHRRGK